VSIVRCPACVRTRVLAAKVFDVLAQRELNIDMISTSPIKISCVIDRDRVEQAVQAAAHAFELSRSRARSREKPSRLAAL